VCNPLKVVTGAIAADSSGLHPTLGQCYELLGIQWPFVTSWYNHFFPHFTPPTTASETEVYALKTVLWLWVLRFDPSTITYDAKWQELVAIFNNASLNWAQLLAWGGAAPGYLAAGTLHSFPTGLTLSTSELVLFNSFSTVCATGNCGYKTQCQQVASTSPCATL